MKTYFMLAIACALAVGLTVPTAQATSLAVGDDRYLGLALFISDGSTPIPDQATLLSGMFGINPTNLGQNFSLPGSFYDRRQVGFGLQGSLTVVNPDGYKIGSGNEINLSPGYDYLMARYGTGEEYHVWWVKDLVVVDIPLELGNNVYPNDPTKPLTEYTLFNPAGPTSVPDAGMTLMLLGGTLLGIEGLRRWFRV